MPITVDWDNEEKTRIYYVFSGAWTWDEFDKVYADVYKMLDTVNHKVHAIVDLSDNRMLPKNTLTEMRRLSFQQHANGGITVFITTNGFAHSLYNVLVKILSRAKEIFRIAHNKEDAYSIIENYEKLLEKA